MQITFTKLSYVAIIFAFDSIIPSLNGAPAFSSTRKRRKRGILLIYKTTYVLNTYKYIYIYTELSVLISF
jgi:hypothetical protein